MKLFSNQTQVTLNGKKAKLYPVPENSLLPLNVNQVTFSFLYIYRQ